MNYVETTDTWESGRCSFIPADHALVCDGRRIVLDRRASAVLARLLESFGKAVEKKELLESAWADRTVNENSLAKAVRNLRVALEGSGLEIVTVHGLGYRVRAGEAAGAGGTADRAASVADSAERTAPRAALHPAVVALGVVLLVVLGWFAFASVTRSPAQVPIRTTPPVTADPPNAKGRILWVDDHPANNTLDARFLRANDYAVHLALSTEEALKLLAFNRYDLIISDLGRGDDRLAGAELVRQIRAEGNRTPYVIYTIRPDDPKRQLAQRRIIADSGATAVAYTPAEVRKMALTIAGGAPRSR